MASGRFGVSYNENTLSEANHYSEMTEQELAIDYLNLPMIPYNQVLRIDRIAILNLDCITKQPSGLLQYKTLRQLDPINFPPCRDPEKDFEDKEQVTPTIIVSGNDRYKTDYRLWFPLSDVIVNIMHTQGKLRKKLLPLTIFIDPENQWLVPLLNLSLGLRKPENDVDIENPSTYC